MPAGRDREGDRKMTKTNELDEWVFAMAPCLRDGEIAEAGRDFVTAALAIPPSYYGDLIKVAAVFNLMHAKDFLDKNVEISPCNYFNRGLRKNSEFLKSAFDAVQETNYEYVPRGEHDDVKDETGDHYGALFSDFDEGKYFDEPIGLLRDRLERNGYPVQRFPEWCAVDVGCGNGRYSLALKALGMRQVVGIDWGELNIRDAVARRDERAIAGVEYRRGNVLDLPLDDESQEFVFCNGVLHHSEDPPKGIRECVRVLKPGRCGFLMLMANPGGLHWDAIEICRIVARQLDYGFVRNVFASLGVPANTRMYFLDHIMVPINIRFTREQCIAMLGQAGARNIRWLDRGADSDRIEALYRGETHAEARYGAGVNAFYFEK